MINTQQEKDQLTKFWLDNKLPTDFKLNKVSFWQDKKTDKVFLINENLDLVGINPVTLQAESYSICSVCYRHGFSETCQLNHKCEGGCNECNPISNDRRFKVNGAINIKIHRDMEDWLLECFTDEYDSETIQNLTLNELYSAINRYYDGGLSEFIENNQQVL